MQQARTLSRGKKAAIWGMSALFVVLCIWQLRKRREDWPLSRYDMYSLVQGKYATRKVLYGATSEGEFALASVGYKVRSGFWFRYGRIARNRKKVDALLSSVAMDYNERRKTDSTLPRLTELRTYEEKWRIESRMHNVDKAKRKLVARHVTEEAKSEAAKQPPKKKARRRKTARPRPLSPTESTP